MRDNNPLFGTAAGCSAGMISDTIAWATGVSGGVAANTGAATAIRVTDSAIDRGCVGAAGATGFACSGAWTWGCSIGFGCAGVRTNSLVPPVTGRRAWTGVRAGTAGRFARNLLAVFWSTEGRLRTVLAAYGVEFCGRDNRPSVTGCEFPRSVFCISWRSFFCCAPCLFDASISNYP